MTSKSSKNETLGHPRAPKKHISKTTILRALKSLKNELF
jgi:hypothetical protein